MIEGRKTVRDPSRFFIPNGIISSPVCLLKRNLVDFVDMITVPNHLHTKKMMPVFSQIQWNLYYQIKSKPVFTGMVEGGVRAKMVLHCSPCSGDVLCG